jgi:hypothetical protein
MISLLKVGMRMVLNIDKSSNTRVMDSSPVERWQIVVVSLVAQCVCNHIHISLVIVHF